MKPSGYIINVARGPILKEADLIKALKEKTIAGAGLDVFEKEPPWESELLKLDNVIAGPHVAALSRDASVRVSTWVAQDIVKVLKHERPDHSVNPQVLEKTLQ
jgi:phosphoglycerate dehydrogenase-like enzyme